MEIVVDSEKINQAVADAIIKSAIGKELTRAINEEVKRLSLSYNNPIVPVVQSHIQGAITTIIEEEFGDKIKNLVREKVTEQFTSELFEKLWDAYSRSR